MSRGEKSCQKVRIFFASEKFVASSLRFVANFRKFVGSFQQFVASFRKFVGCFQQFVGISGHSSRRSDSLIFFDSKLFIHYAKNIQKKELNIFFYFSTKIKLSFLPLVDFDLSFNFLSQFLPATMLQCKHENTCLQKAKAPNNQFLSPLLAINTS